MRWIFVNAVRAGLGAFIALPLASQGSVPAFHRLPGHQLIEEHNGAQPAETGGRQAIRAKEREYPTREREQARAEADEWLRQLAAAMSVVRTTRLSARSNYPITCSQPWRTGKLASCRITV